MAHGGEALGRDKAGRVIFVPYAIAGEEVRVEVVEAKKGFARARLVEVITPSPMRVTPQCPHFGPPSSHPPTPSPPSGRGDRDSSRPFPPADPPHSGKGGGTENLAARGCGGCQWQHIDYPSQLEFKREIVREQFARIGKMPDAPVAPPRSGRPWGYRNNMRFALDEHGRMCQQALESHDLVPIRECHILNPALVSMFGALELEGADFDSVTLRAGENTDDRMIIFKATDTAPPEIETDEAVSIVFEIAASRSGSVHGENAVITLIGKESIEEQVGGRAFRISPRAFFQVNTPIAEVLLSLVAEFLAPRPDDVLLDAYGGVGLFGLSLAGRVSRVIEIEENAEALEDARYNARDLPAERAEFHSGRVEDILRKLSFSISLAIVDPPRAGLTSEALDALLSQAPRVVVYVSCDPATLARDARRLADGGYRVTHIQPVDLFPQTYHIECVSRFERGN